MRSPWSFTFPARFLFTTTKIEPDLRLGLGKFQDHYRFSQKSYLNYLVKFVLKDWIPNDN